MATISLTQHDLSTDMHHWFASTKHVLTPAWLAQGQRAAEPAACIARNLSAWMLDDGRPANFQASRQFSHLLYNEHETSFWRFEHVTERMQASLTFCNAALHTSPVAIGVRIDRDAPARFLMSQAGSLQLKEIAKCVPRFICANH